MCKANRRMMMVHLTEAMLFRANTVAFYFFYLMESEVSS